MTRQDNKEKMTDKCPCICKSLYQNCKECKCVLVLKRPCRGCNKGANCQNPYNNRPQQQNQDNGAEPEPSTTVAAEQLGEGEGNENQPLIWKNLNIEHAKSWVNKAYDEIVRWSASNLFEPPMCDATKGMIKEMTLLLHNYNNDSPVAPIALKALAVIPHLFCQRTHQKSKYNENTEAMRRRLELWEKGELNNLLDEARALQSRMCRRKRV